MADSDGGHVWPPRASDLRIQELTGNGPEGSRPDDVFQALRAAGYVGSLDDMWKQHKAAKGITDTSEIFTGSLALSAAPAPSMLANLHGTDGQTTFTDAGTAGSTATFTGTAELSNAQVLYGSTALNTPGTDGNEMSYDGQGTNYDLGTGDWEIEANVRFDNQAGGNAILELNNNDGSVTTALNAQWQLLNSNGSFNFQWSTTGSTWSFVDTLLDFTLGEWTHLSIRKRGNTVYYALDGAQSGITSDFTSVTLFTPVNPADLNFGPTMDGQMDGARITIGSTQHPYPGSFTPPDAAFGSEGSDWDFSAPAADTRNTGAFPPLGYWDYVGGADLALTDGTGGVGTTGLDPILDVIDSVSRRLTGVDFSPDGTNCVCSSYSGNIASFSLSTAWDLSTATQTGTTKTGITLANNVHYVNGGSAIAYMETGDRLAYMPLATTWQVASTDTPVAGKLNKTDWGRGVNSYDGPYRMSENGAYAVGVVRDVNSPFHYFISVGSLSTPYDPSTLTSVTEFDFGTSSPMSSPTAGHVQMSDDGTEIILFDGANPEGFTKLALSTAYNASTGVRSPKNTEANVATAYSMVNIAPDLSRIHMWNAIFVTNFDTYGVYAI